MKSGFYRDHLPLGANGTLHSHLPVLFILNSHLPALFSSCICLQLPKTAKKQTCDFLKLPFTPKNLIKAHQKHISWIYYWFPKLLISGVAAEDEPSQKWDVNQHMRRKVQSYQIPHRLSTERGKNSISLCLSTCTTPH